MTERRRGLGRGLGALIPSAQSADQDEQPSTEPVLGRHGGRASEPALSVVRGDAVAAPNGDDAAHARADAANFGATAATTVLDGSEPATDETAQRYEPAHEVAISAGGEEYATHERDADFGARYAELEVDSIRPNPRQPRQVFDEEALGELVHSIREIGVLQPVVVRELPRGEDARFELVMGERRWRAAREAGLSAVPAIIRETSDTALLRDALLENLHRAQLNPLEEAAAYDQLLQDFGCTQEELSERIGRSRPQISNTIRLLKLPPSVQRRLAVGVLSAGHARAILGVSEPAAQERLAQRVVAEGLSVRTVEEIVAVGAADGPERPRASRTRRPVAPGLAEIASALSDRLDTRVRIDLSRNRGKLVVEFAAVDDLNRIVALMGLDPRTAEVNLSTEQQGDLATG